MIDLGSTDFYIGVPSMPRSEFERYSKQLFESWEPYVEKTLALSDYSLALEVEEGSVKGVGKIATVLGTLYLGIGYYGSFVSGLQTIRTQIGSVGEFLGNRAALPFREIGVETRLRKHGGSLSQLYRLFVRVQRGEMTADQAMNDADSLLADEAAASPEFMLRLQEALAQTPRFPEQSLLAFDDLEQEAIPISGRNRAPRPSPPKPNLPLVQQLRVEVWRESKNGRRKIRVTQL